MYLPVLEIEPEDKMLVWDFSCGNCTCCWCISQCWKIFFNIRKFSWDTKNLKLNFWGTKRYFLAILIRWIPGVAPQDAGRHRFLPPFPNWGHTRKSDFPSKSYGCLKFKKKTMFPAHFLSPLGAWIRVPWVRVTHSNQYTTKSFMLQY